jgi:hypothetical protein
VKSPLTPLFQIPHKAGPFAKGGEEGFSLQCPCNYRLISKSPISYKSADGGLGDCFFVQSDIIKISILLFERIIVKSLPTSLACPRQEKDG